MNGPILITPSTKKFSENNNMCKQGGNYTLLCTDERNQYSHYSYQRTSDETHVVHWLTPLLGSCTSLSWHWHTVTGERTNVRANTGASLLDGATRLTNCATRSPPGGGGAARPLPPQPPTAPVIIRSHLDLENKTPLLLSQLAVT